LADETVLFELVSASNFLLTGKLTRAFPVPGVILQNGHAINAKFQSHAVKFPKQKNRESFEASREMTKLNRISRQSLVFGHALAVPSTGSLEEDPGSNVVRPCASKAVLTQNARKKPSYSRLFKEAREMRRVRREHGSRARDRLWGCGEVLYSLSP
jgi:hypothetical protein